MVIKEDVEDLVFYYIMIMDKYCIITFKNANDAMISEDFLRNKKINMDIVPTPVFITQSCGISIKVDVNYINNIKLLAEDKKFPFKKIYIRKKDGYKIIYI